MCSFAQQPFQLLFVSPLWVKRAPVQSFASAASYPLREERLGAAGLSAAVPLLTHTHTHTTPSHTHSLSLLPLSSTHTNTRYPSPQRRVARQSFPSRPVDASASRERALRFLPLPTATALPFLFCLPKQPHSFPRVPGTAPLAAGCLSSDSQTSLFVCSLNGPPEVSAGLTIASIPAKDAIVNPPHRTHHRYAVLEDDKSLDVHRV